MVASRRFVLALSLVLTSQFAFAHGGGLNREGCHTNRKTGDYHCHGSSARSSEPSREPSPAPASSRRGSPSPRPVAASLLTSQPSPTAPERDLVRAAQLLLQALGYTPSLLGAADERTTAAVRAFQKAEAMRADGVVTEYLVLRLAEKVAAKCP